MLKGKKMKAGKKHVFLFLFITWFLFVSCVIDLFHFHPSFKSASSCPACHFLQSSLSGGIALFILILLLSFLGFFRLKLIFTYKNDFSISLLSRSPPWS